MTNNLKAQTTTAEKATAELILFLIDNREEVLKALKNTHNLALYFTSEPLQPEDRTDLFYCNELRQFIQNIPQ